MEAKFTPGPWTAFPTEFCMVGGNGRKVCLLPSAISDELTANAQLIAAAPDLLEGCRDALAEIVALQRAIDNANGVDTEENLLAETLRGIIAKATGEQVAS